MSFCKLLALTLVHTLLTKAEPNNTLAYIYLDNVEYLAASNNVAPMLLSTLEEAFVQTKPTDSAGFSGYDWTQPFPGVKVDGFDAHLRIAYDVPFPESVVQNSTSAVTALTFSNPPSMMGETNVTKPMDPSWFICQHLFVSDKPDSTAAIDHTCGFLPPTCLQDLKSGLTEDWGKLDPTTPCPGQVFDAVPLSCQDALGVSRADVLGKSIPPSSTVGSMPLTDAYLCSLGCHGPERSSPGRSVDRRPGLPVHMEDRYGVP